MCLFIMLQNHLILHLILLTQPEVTQCYEIVTHYPFRLYNTPQGTDISLCHEAIFGP